MVDKECLLCGTKWTGWYIKKVPEIGIVDSKGEQICRECIDKIVYNETFIRFHRAGFVKESITKFIIKNPWILFAIF